MVITKSSVFVQDFDGSPTPDTIFDHDFASELTDSDPHVVEWVANYDTGDVVVILDHEVIGSFNSPRIGALAQLMPDWETGFDQTNSDHRPYHDHVAAEWLDDEIDPATLSYFNAFLEAEELDPIVLPEPITFGFIDAQFVEGSPLSSPVSFTLTDNEIADLLPAFCGNATGATIPDLPASGPTYVTPTNGTISGASNAVRVGTKLVTVAGDESTGPWSANTDAELLLVGKYRGFTVGVCASATGTNATITWPALSGFTAGSYVLLFALHESASADFSGAPATFTNRKRVVTADYNAILLDNILSGPVSSFAGATLNGGNSDAYKAIALELKPV
jgi:hypothetical protein